MDIRLIGISAVIASRCLKPNLLQLNAVKSWNSLVGTLSFPPQALRVGVVCGKLLATNEVIDVWTSQLPSTLFALLESIAGNRTCAAGTCYRPLAVSRGADIGRSLQVVLEAEICTALDTILFSTEAKCGSNCQSLVRWALMARPLIVGSAEQERDGVEGNEITYTKTGAYFAAASTARTDAAPVFDVSSPCRWQVRCQAARCLATALQEIALNAAAADQYDASLAMKVLKGLHAQGSKPPSFLAFHLSELLSSAASTAVVATVDQSELRLVEQGMRLFPISEIFVTQKIPELVSLNNTPRRCFQQPSTESLQPRVNFQMCLIQCYLLGATFCGRF